MDIWKIRFANLKLDYDPEKIKAEIDNIKDFYDLCSTENILTEQWRIPLFTDEQIQNTTVYSANLNKIIHKKYPGWKGCSFTHLEENPASKTGASKIRNNNIKSRWLWREDLKIPYIRSLVDSLDFKILHTVRLLMIPANSIGLVHQDDQGAYYKQRGFSITLNVHSGGSPIVFIEDEKIHEAWPDKCHIFRDDCWHGIPQVQSTRIQIRINGIPNKKLIESLLDLDSILIANQVDNIA